MNTDNAFELFSLTPCIYVNQIELDAAFQRLQLLYHPDNYTCPIDKQAALTLSAKISQQYAALKTPLGCVNAVLKRHNLDSIENISKTNNDMEIMQDIFAMQEALIDFKAKDDVTGIKQLNDTLQERISAIEPAFILAHKNNNTSELKKQAIRFSYLIKFQQNIV